MREIKVKPLEWRELTGTIFAATTIMGPYKSYDINLNIGIAKPMWRRPVGEKFTASSIEAAKAAAQADYEARILSALSVPAPVEAETAEGWMMVPREPTVEMLAAAIPLADGEPPHDAKNLAAAALFRLSGAHNIPSEGDVVVHAAQIVVDYRAMIAAAPKGGSDG